MLLEARFRPESDCRHFLHQAIQHRLFIQAIQHRAIITRVFGMLWILLQYLWIGYPPAIPAYKQCAVQIVGHILAISEEVPEDEQGVRGEDAVQWMQMRT